MLVSHVTGACMFLITEQSGFALAALAVGRYRLGSVIKYQALINHRKVYRASGDSKVNSSDSQQCRNAVYTGSMAQWLAHLEFELGDPGSIPQSCHYKKGVFGA